MKYIHIAEPMVGEEEWKEIQEPIITGWLTQGPKVREFEKKFAYKHGVKHAIAVTSCTTALHLALRAVGVSQGDYVIVPSFTWIATANAVEYCGATPVFCDNDLNTYNIDVKKLEELLQKMYKAGKVVKAIVPVHLFGLVAEMDSIRELAKQYGGIRIVEDAACAAGAKYHDQFAGSLGDIGCFSFHPRKVITTGEGGMCTTNDALLSEKMSVLRSHGAVLSEEQRHHSDRPYLMPDFNELGFNYRMSDLQGAMGSVQIDKLDALIAERREWAKFYDEKLKAVRWIIPPKAPMGCFHSYQAYVCRVDKRYTNKSRNQIMQALHEAGIGSRAGTHAIHELGYYSQKYHLTKDDFQIAAELYANTIALPLHNRMTAEDYRRVVETIRKL